MLHIIWTTRYLFESHIEWCILLWEAGFGRCVYFGPSSGVNLDLLEVVVFVLSFSRRSPPLHLLHVNWQEVTGSTFPFLEVAGRSCRPSAWAISSFSDSGGFTVCPILPGAVSHIGMPFLSGNGLWWRRSWFWLLRHGLLIAWRVCTQAEFVSLSVLGLHEEGGSLVCRTKIAHDHTSALHPRPVGLHPVKKASPAGVASAGGGNLKR